MSTLTKVLIILLSLSALFLCGSMVIFVGSANNFKQAYASAKDINDTLTAEVESVKADYSTSAEKMKLRERELNGRIRFLEDENSTLTVELGNATRANTEKQARVDSWAGVVLGFEQSIDNLIRSLKLTQDQLVQSQAEGISSGKNLAELTSKLDETLVQLESTNAEKRRLLERVTNIEDKLSQPDVRVTAPETSVVTPMPDIGARSAPLTIDEDAELNGLVTEVGRELVTISLGSADGVTVGTAFYVYRGSKFVCDLIITDVEVDKSAGKIELVQDMPRINDNVTTKL